MPLHAFLPRIARHPSISIILVQVPPADWERPPLLRLKQIALFATDSVEPRDASLDESARRAAFIPPDDTSRTLCTFLYNANYCTAAFADAKPAFPGRPRTTGDVAVCIGWPGNVSDAV